MIKKLVKAQNGISHIQSSSAVLNLPPSSSHSLAGEAPDKKRRKRKSAKGRQRHREEQMKNTSQGFLTSLGLIPSSPSPHFVLHGCVLKFFLSCFFFKCCFVNFSVLEVASPPSLASNRWKKCAQERHRVSGIVQLDC